MKLAAVGDNCMDIYDDTGMAYPGGNPVNVAVYFARLGGEASYTGVVGTDKYGPMMKECIAKKGVDVSTVVEREGATPTTHVRIVNGDRIFGAYDEGVMAGYRLTEEQRAYLRAQDLLVSGPWGGVHDDLLDLKSGGALVAFDASTEPDGKVARAALPATDYLFFSYSGEDSPALRQKMRELHAKGPKVVNATMGARGSLCFDGNEFTSCGIVPCEVVDTLGAGDSYIAGFLKGVSDGLPIIECMKMGAQCASVTIGYSGAW